METVRHHVPPKPFAGRQESLLYEIPFPKLLPPTHCPPSQPLSSQDLPILGKHLSNYHHTRWAYCQLLFILTSDSFQGVCFFFPWGWRTGERSVSVFAITQNRSDFLL